MATHRDEPRRGAAAFIGRLEELAILKRALEEARTGRPRLVTVEGSAGVGKTALLSVFLASLQGVQSFLVSAEEAESVLPLGLVDQVLRQFGATLGSIPPLAPNTGVGMLSGDFKPFTVGSALLAALGEIEGRGPLVLIVEDVHWADAISLQALTFAFRRLQAERLLLVLSVRDDGLTALTASMRRLLDEPRATRIHLKGLRPEEVRSLSSHCGLRISANAARRLQEHTGGNPLYVRALLGEMEPTALERDWGELLPSPRPFSEIILGRLERCQPVTRKLVKAAAVLGPHCPLGQALCLADLPDPLTALDEAVASSLLSLAKTPSGDELRFEHPLVCAAVYHSLPMTRRMALHAAAARIANDEALQLRHEAAARYGTDEELAARLERYARRQMFTSSWSIAATAMVSAAQLTQARADRERCILDAIDCHLLAGDVVTGAALGGDLDQYLPTARRDYVIGRLRQLDGRLAEAEKLFAQAWTQLAPDMLGEEELASRIAGWQATVLVNSGRAREGIDWARRAVLAIPSDLAGSTFAMSILLIGLASRGDTKEVLRLVAGLSKNPADVGPKDFEQLLGRGVARLWSDQVLDARSDLVRAVDLGRERGAVHLMIPALFHLADAEYRLGEWDSAVAHGELAASTAEDSEQRFLSGCAHAIAALPYVARGSWEQAECHVRDASQVAHTVGDLASVAYAAVASARLALMQDQPGVAIRCLEPLIVLDHEPLNEFGIAPWQLLYVEALYEQGDLEAAAAWLTQATCQIHEQRQLSVLVFARRLEGQLEARAGHLDRAVSAFEKALADVHVVTAPFEIARLQLTYGAVLRRMGRQRAARAHLQAARAGFLTLRAEPFLERCDVELAGTGLRPVRRTPDERHLLTSQELAVAKLVAEGLTNRDVAAQLVLSPRTVEYHLLHVFGKLGIRSRSQLVRYMLAQ